MQKTPCDEDLCDGIPRAEESHAPAVVPLPQDRGCGSILLGPLLHVVYEVVCNAIEDGEDVDRPGGVGGHHLLQCLRSS